MKDLDFDELDKAVNSLMTNVPKADEAKTPGTESEKTLDLTPSTSTPSVATDNAPPSSQPVTAAVSDSQAPAVVPSPAQTPPASRRGGRFMDVVHPSSDMKNQTPVVPSRPISRQGVAVEPRADATQPPERTPLQRSAEPLEKTASFSPEPVSTVNEKAAPASEWPDPLEMTGFKDHTESSEKDAPKNVPEELPSSSSRDLEEQSPLTSPFLPDAKVEKRPLGSGMPTPEEPDRAPIAGSETSKTVDDPDAQLPALPADVEQPLPEELQGEMMAVEADTHMGVPKTDETHPLKDTTHEATPPEPATKSTVSTPEPAEVTAPTGPTSISQQYREEPSTGDTHNGAIYDTDTYHQPLSHPVKKKSGWLWVVWIVVILLVGAGGGAALYFLGAI